MELSFEALRAANRARLPIFKNKHGTPAHALADGSDWSPAQWLQAVVGELGEWAQKRLAFERGALSAEELAEQGGEELADVVTYVDLLALRSLDETTQHANCNPDPADHLLRLIAHLGHYANERKKFERGDHLSRNSMLMACGTALDMAQHELWLLTAAAADAAQPRRVSRANQWGVVLGAAVRAKFNKISDRIGCDVRL